jgi:hypothetical protein
MCGNVQVRFGGRAGETDQRQRRNRAPTRPYPFGPDAAVGRRAARAVIGTVTRVLRLRIVGRSRQRRTRAVLDRRRRRPGLASSAGLSSPAATVT